jgi:hypothetical protein
MTAEKSATKTVLFVVLMASLVGAACTRGSASAPAPQPEVSASPAPSPTGDRPERDLKVWNEAVGKSRKRVRAAIRDLKRVGMWQKLIWKDLYVVQIQSRPGVQRVPEDGHLADASYHSYIDDDGSGSLCFILFYGRALKNDLDRWNSYAAQGIARYDPPTLEDYWAAVLAHELGHCHRGLRGEKVARRWESRAWIALGRPDLADFAIQK